MLNTRKTQSFERSFTSWMKSQLIGYVSGGTLVALLARGIQGLIQHKVWYNAAKLSAPQLVAAQIAFTAIKGG